MYENIKNQDITEKKDVIEEFFAADDGGEVVDENIVPIRKSAGLIGTIIIMGLIFISPQVLLKYLPIAHANYIIDNGLLYDIFISIFSIIYLVTLFLNHAWKDSINWTIVIIIILLILFKYLSTSSSSDVFPIFWWFIIGIMLLFVNINNRLDIFKSIDNHNLKIFGGLIIPIVIIIFVLHIVGFNINISHDIYT
jgi:hypothetical protein